MAQVRVSSLTNNGFESIDRINQLSPFYFPKPLNEMENTKEIIFRSFVTLTLGNCWTDEASPLNRQGDVFEYQAPAGDNWITYVNPEGGGPTSLLADKFGYKSGTLDKG